jgi:hypothetical protein
MWMTQTEGGAGSLGGRWQQRITEIQVIGGGSLLLCRCGTEDCIAGEVIDKGLGLLTPRGTSHMRQVLTSSRITMPPAAWCAVVWFVT